MNVSIQEADKKSLDMEYIIETERLKLRKLALEDSGFLIELLNSPGWIKYISDKNVHTVEDAHIYLKDGPFQSFSVNGFGLCMVELLSDDTPIGICGLIKREFLSTPDLGFAYLPQFHGKGYAFEMAQAIVIHAKEKLKISTLSAITLESNMKSKQLLKKLGFHYNQNITSPTGEKLQLYEL